MKKPLLIAIILMLFVSPFCLATNYYQWSDQAYVTHISDRPSNNKANGQENNAATEAIALPKDSISLPDTIPVKNPTTTSKATPYPPVVAKNLHTYKKLLVMQPQNQETLQYNEGKINIALSLEPELKNSDQIALYLDGNKIKEIKSASFTLENVERGEHHLQAQIISKDGAILLVAPKVVFYVHQTSVQ